MMSNYAIIYILAFHHSLESRIRADTILTTAKLHDHETRKARCHSFDEFMPAYLHWEIKDNLLGPRSQIKHLLGTNKK